MSSVSNGLYFLTLPLVSVMRVIYRKIRHARYLYIKRNVQKSLGCALSIEKYCTMLLNTVFMKLLKDEGNTQEVPKQRSLAADLCIWPELTGRASDIFV